MKFLIYQCVNDPEYFLVTDTAHRDRLSADLCPGGGRLKEIGYFREMGESRVAFNEMQAKASIKKKGYYRFHAESLADVPIAPEMPG